MRLLLAPLLNYARKLKYPALFKLVAGLFVLSLVIPDPIPLLDELLLGLGTLLLARLKSRDDDAPEEKQQDGKTGNRAPIDGRATRV